MFRSACAIVLLSTVAVNAFVAPSAPRKSSFMNMLFSFGSKKAAPKPSAKAPPAPVPKGFANGLVGSDIELKDFDPLKLSEGRSEETINWYRAAELKVFL